MCNIIKPTKTLPIEISEIALKIKQGPELSDIDQIIVSISQLLKKWESDEELTPYEIIYIYRASLTKFFTYIINLTSELPLSLYLKIIVM